MIQVPKNFNDNHQFESDKTMQTQGCKPPFDQLGVADVICGRHKEATHNIGNRRFRILIALSIRRYVNSPTRAHKSAVIRDIVDTIHGYGGRFVQSKAKNVITWEELDEKQIHDKVGHALRDMSSCYEEKSDMTKLLCPIQSILTTGSSSFFVERSTPCHAAVGGTKPVVVVDDVFSSLSNAKETNCQEDRIITNFGFENDWTIYNTFDHDVNDDCTCCTSTTAALA